MIYLSGLLILIGTFLTGSAIIATVFKITEMISQAILGNSHDYDYSGACFVFAVSVTILILGLLLH